MIDVKKLKSRREELGLNQTELARRIGIGQAHYSRIEKGLRGASQETLDAIIQVLCVPIADIWDSSADAPQDEDAGTKNIIFEYGEGKNRTRCILPPTPESYAFVADRMDGASDPRLEALINMWKLADEAAKDEIFAALSHREWKNELTPDAEKPEKLGA